VPEDWFRIDREPYWIGELRIESLSSLTIDGLARLLPAWVRRKRQQKQFGQAVDKAVTRNVSDLHWTMRQNIDDSFRRLLAASREAVDASIASTRALLAMAQERRRAKDVSLEHELEHARLTERRLTELRGELDRHGRGDPS
jgi:hypothetical protein